MSHHSREQSPAGSDGRPPQRVVSGSLRDRIAKFENASAVPLAPSRTYGAGLGLPSSSYARGGLVGNRLPSLDPKTAGIASTGPSGPRRASDHKGGLVGNRIPSSGALTPPSGSGSATTEGSTAQPIQPGSVRSSSPAGSVSSSAVSATNEDSESAATSGASSPATSPGGGAMIAPQLLVSSTLPNDLEPSGAMTPSSTRAEAGEEASDLSMPTTPVAGASDLPRPGYDLVPGNLSAVSAVYAPSVSSSLVSQYDPTSTEASEIGNNLKDVSGVSTPIGTPRQARRDLDEDSAASVKAASSVGDVDDTAKDAKDESKAETNHADEAAVTAKLAEIDIAKPDNSTAPPTSATQDAVVEAGATESKIDEAEPTECPATAEDHAQADAAVAPNNAEFGQVPVSTEDKGTGALVASSPDSSKTVVPPIEVEQPGGAKPISKSMTGDTLSTEGSAGPATPTALPPAPVSHPDLPSSGARAAEEEADAEVLADTGPVDESKQKQEPISSRASLDTIQGVSSDNGDSSPESALDREATPQPPDNSAAPASSLETPPALDDNSDIVSLGGLEPPTLPDDLTPDIEINSNRSSMPPARASSELEFRYEDYHDQFRNPGSPEQFFRPFGDPNTHDSSVSASQTAAAESGQRAHTRFPDAGGIRTAGERSDNPTGIDAAAQHDVGPVDTHKDADEAAGAGSGEGYGEKAKSELSAGAGGVGAAMAVAGGIAVAAAVGASGFNFKPFREGTQRSIEENVEDEAKRFPAVPDTNFDGGNEGKKPIQVHVEPSPFGPIDDTKVEEAKPDAEVPKMVENGDSVVKGVFSLPQSVPGSPPAFPVAPAITPAEPHTPARPLSPAAESAPTSTIVTPAGVQSVLHSFPPVPDEEHPYVEVHMSPAHAGGSNFRPSSPTPVSPSAQPNGKKHNGSQITIPPRTHASLDLDGSPETRDEPGLPNAA